MTITSSRNCVKCIQLHEEYEKYLQFTEFVIKSYIIDCDQMWKNLYERQQFKICDPSNIDKLPKINFYIPPKKEFNPYEQKQVNIPKEIPYEDDEFTAEKIVGAARYLMPNFTKNITSTEELNIFMQDTSLPLKVLLFTDSEEISHDWKGLSSYFRQRADIGIISQNCIEIIEKYQINNYPQIVIELWDSQAQSYKQIMYKGGNRFESLRAFLSRYALKKKIYTYKSQFEEKLNNQTIQILSVEDIKKEIIPKKGEWSVVHIYKQEKQQHQQYQQIKEKFGQFFTYYQYEYLDSESENKLKQVYKTVKFPALLIYPINQKKKSISGFIEITSSDSYEKIAELLIDYIPINSQILDDKQAPLFVKKTYESNKFPIIWFFDTDKIDSKLHGLFIHSLSNNDKFAPYLAYGRYMQPDQNTFKLWEINTSPTVIGFAGQTNTPGQKGDRRINFDEDFTFNNLHNYLSELCYIKEKEIIENQKIQESDTMEDFQKLCLKNQNSCIIAFLNPVRKAKFTIEYELFEKFKMHSLSRNHNWTWINGFCHKEVLKYFSLTQADLPFIVYYDPQKQKYKAFSDQAFTLQDMLIFGNKLQKKRKGLKSIEGDIDIDERNCQKLIEEERVKISNRNKKQNNQKKEDL